MLKPIDSEMGLLPNIILYDVAEAYGFNEFLVFPYMNINEIPVSINQRSETSRKAVLESDHNMYLLKEFPWYTEDEERVQELLKFQSELYENGVPVPKIIQTKYGDLYIEIYKKKLFLQEYLEGVSWKSTVSQANQIGRMLATFHVTSRNLSTMKPWKFRLQSLFDLAQGILTLLTKKFVYHRKQLPLKEEKIISSYLHIANNRIKKLKAHCMSLGYGKEKLIVHGDFNPNNLIYTKKDQVLGLIDFDNATFDDPLHDLAEGLINVSGIRFRPFSSRYQEFLPTLNSERFIAFLQGYKSKVTMKIDWELLPYCIATTYIELMTLGLLRGDLLYRDALSRLNQLDLIISQVHDYL
ncbi:phosphotransferase enzyme family protein [Paenactinomyces guangxiensis]|uniref:Phosphotransferase n=1 Tax=Paenactinomyces guangxiensis TaxID=1490290 RepID=A0A7W1WP53_9BACL|nr:phosphotransferase [Paenactinomyces guangxiensis]MBA4493465.1 phosphotransferase [Paenactinomyces guangxiensis]MBH8590556.1 phosphotransferase [Paenactinomyces guangxiensis]